MVVVMRDHQEILINDSESNLKEYEQCLLMKFLEEELGGEMKHMTY